MQIICLLSVSRIKDKVISHHNDKASIVSPSYATRMFVFFFWSHNCCVGLMSLCDILHWYKILHAILGSPGIFFVGKGRPAYKADNLTAICEPIV
jgi:hypothetical protein